MMRKGSSLLIGLGIGMVALFLGRKAVSFKRMGDLLSISAGLDGKPSVKGGILGKLLVPIKVEFSNRSDQEITLQIPSVKLLYNKKQIGDVIPNSKSLVIKKYAKSTFKGLTFEIGITSLFSNGVAKDLLLSAGGPSEVAKKMSVRITAIANGVSVTTEQSLSGVNGLGLTATSSRVIKSKSDYAHLIAPLGALDKTDPVINENGSVEDTVRYMIDIVDTYKADTAKLAKALKKSTLEDTLQNIWNFVYTYIKYEPDSKLFEQLRRPLRTLHDQKGDCDCYSLLIGSLLKNLNIEFKFRITSYYGRPYFQHVYVIVPTKGGKYITVDPVVDAFNYEKPFTNHKDFELKN